MGIDGSVFQEELLALDQMGKKRIQIWINSVGGVVMDGYNICNAILKSKTRVDTYCLGMAASISGVIFQTGRKRVMADYGILMYHNPSAGDVNRSPQLDSMKSSLNKIISERSGMDALAVNKMTDRESFIQADEAMTLGLCDEIETTIQMNTKNFPKEARAYAAEASKVLNKIFQPTKSHMKKVTNKLSLTEDANEDSIIEAMATATNKAVDTAVTNITTVLNKKSADELAKMKADMDDVEAKLATAKTEYETCKAELDTANASIATATASAAKILDAANEAAAKELVVGYVKLGKIKNEAAVIVSWTAKAKADMVGVKAMLESIPTNKAAVKFEVANTTVKVEGNAVAVAMAKIENKMSKK